MLSALIGESKAEGDYVLFFDQDDLIHRDVLFELYQVVRGHNPDIISFDYHVYVNETHCQTSHVLHPNKLITNNNVFLMENNTTMWNKAFKKILFSKANIQWDGPYAYDEDRNLVTILRSVASSQYDLDKDLYAWVIHNNGLHLKLDERIEQFIDYGFQKYVLDFIKNKVTKEVFENELDYAVGHCYEGIILISKSKIIEYKRKKYLLNQIKRSDCFKQYLSHRIYSRHYYNRFNVITVLVIFLFRFNMYSVLFIFSRFYEKIKRHTI